jgi:hypothetical protein
MRWRPRCGFLCILLAAAATPGQTAPETPVPPELTDPREIIRRAADNDLENDLRQRNYTYIQHSIQRKLNGQGEVKSTESETHEVMVLFGEQVQRLLEKNDQPLSAKDAAKEEERISKLVEKRRHESDDDRRKRVEKFQEKRDRQRAFVKEVTDAFDFTLLAPEVLDSRENYVIVAEPKQAYEPRSREAKFITKFRFRVWVDKLAYQWAQVDAEALDTISFGLFLARVHKGTHVHVEQVQVNEEVWLPRFVNLKLDAKIALLKNIDYDIDVRFRDYKKFRTETKITGAGEAPP